MCLGQKYHTLKNRSRIGALLGLFAKLPIEPVIARSEATRRSDPTGHPERSEGSHSTSGCVDEIPRKTRDASSSRIATAAGAPGIARGSTSAVLARGKKPRASGELKARPFTKSRRSMILSAMASVTYPIAAEREDGIFLRTGKQTRRN